MLHAGEKVRAKHEFAIGCLTVVDVGREYEVIRGKVEGTIGILDNYGVDRLLSSSIFEAVKKPVGCDHMKHDHPSIGKFVIGSLHLESGFSMRPKPKTHNTEQQAKKECERLARLDPTKKFVYFEVKGACQMHGINWE